MTTQILGVSPSRVDTTREFALGTQAEQNGVLYEYVKATGAITQYHVVAISEDGEVAAGYAHDASSVPARIGIAQATLASGEYGWVARKGLSLTVKTVSGATADGKVYTSATAGAVASSSSSQSLIQGLRLNAAYASPGNTACSALTELTAFCA